MKQPLDLPAALIDRMERLRTTSAAVLRDKVYEVLGAAGCDVDRLVRDSRIEIVDELEGKAKTAAQRIRMLRDRIAAGKLAPEKLEQAKQQLREAPATVKAQRQVIKRIEARPPPPLPSAPTRELIRHYGEAPKVETREANGELLAQPRHRFEWAVDRMAVALSAEEYGAALRLRDAYLRRQNNPGAVDWTRSGASVPGSRLPIRDEQLRASHDWNAIWLRLDPTLRLIVSNFILEQPPRGQDHPLDAIAFGKLYGQTVDKAKARGVTVGAVRTACVVIARLFDEYDRWRAQKRREEQNHAR